MLHGLCNLYRIHFLNMLLANEECPIGYAGKLPNCHDIDKF